MAENNTGIYIDLIPGSEKQTRGSLAALGRVAGAQKPKHDQVLKLENHNSINPDYDQQGQGAIPTDTD